MKEVNKKNLKRLKDLGKKIADRRKLLRFSQEELALIIEIDRGYLSRVENGKTNPTLDLIYRIQDVLEMEIFI